MIEIYKNTNSTLSGILLVIEIMAFCIASFFLRFHFVINEYLMLILLVGSSVSVFFLHRKFFPKRLKLYIRVYDEYMEVYQEEMVTIPFAYIYYIDYIVSTYYSSEDGEKEYNVGIDISWKGENSAGIIELKESSLIDMTNGLADVMTIEDLMCLIRQHMYKSHKEEAKALRGAEPVKPEVIRQEELQAPIEQKSQLLYTNDDDSEDSEDSDDNEDREEKPWWKCLFEVYGPVIVIIMLVVIAAGLANIAKMVKTTNSIILPRLDALTEVPSVRYLTVDFMDVEESGIRYHNSRYLKKETYVEYWAFPVKGHENVWVTIALMMTPDESFSWEEQRDKCLELLHSRQEYDRAKEDTYKKRIVHYMSLSSKRVEKVKNKVVLLNRMGLTPVIGGGVYYLRAMDALRRTRDHSPDYQLALSLLQQSAEGGYPEGQYKLAEMYLRGDHVQRNVDKALHWYKAASQQERNFRIKCEALIAMSNIYAECHQYEKALEAIDSAIEEIPNDANCYESKGVLLYKLGDIKGAQRMWEKVKTLDPNFEKNHKSSLRKLLTESSHSIRYR
jgi:tetratricopeptide (TPR) repeat protein